MPIRYFGKPRSTPWIRPALAQALAVVGSRIVAVGSKVVYQAGVEYGGESPGWGGRRNAKGVVHPVVFGVSACLIAVSAFGAAVPTLAAEVFSAIQGWIVHTFGWFYMLCIAVFLIFVLYLAFSRFGAVRLGPDDSEPEYSRLSWFAMLFSAGIGIGLLFFGVAEPLLHFAAPPAEGIEGQTPEAARFAMNATFLHWGVHGWAVYGLIGLALAYFTYRHNMPLTLRSALYPLLGERIHGPLGNAVDIAAVIGTVFGVATSLGLGVLQVNAGLNYLFGVPEVVWVQVSLIAAITLMATASVVAGLDAGIKRLSELNMLLAVALLLIVFALGPTVFLLSAFYKTWGPTPPSWWPSPSASLPTSPTSGWGAGPFSTGLGGWLGRPS